jgi:hypothetical protein
MGWGKIVPFVHYNERWRKYRRLSTIGFSKKAAERYHSGQARDVHLFLQRTLDEPDMFTAELKRYGCSTPSLCDLTPRKCTDLSVRSLCALYTVTQSKDPQIHT